MVEGLLSTGPTPSSFIWGNSSKQIYQLPKNLSKSVKKFLASIILLLLALDDRGDCNKEASLRDKNTLTVKLVV